MTNSSTLNRPVANNGPSTLSSLPISQNGPSCRKQTINCVYQADQQVKLLHLQVEVDSLLLELQTRKGHKSATINN